MKLRLWNKVLEIHFFFGDPLTLQRREIARRVDEFAQRCYHPYNTLDGIRDVKEGRIKAVQALNLVKDLDGQTTRNGAKDWVKAAFANGGEGKIL